MCRILMWMCMNVSILAGQKMFTDVFLLDSSNSNLNGFDYRNKTRVAVFTQIGVSSMLYVSWLLHLESLGWKKWKFKSSVFTSYTWLEYMKGKLLLVGRFVMTRSKWGDLFLWIWSSGCLSSERVCKCGFAVLTEDPFYFCLVVSVVWCCAV